MAQDQSRDGQGTPPGLTASRVLALVLCAVAFFVGALAMAGWISNQPQWRSFLAEARR